MSKPDISEHAAQRPAQTNGAVGSSEVMTTLSFFFSLEGAEALEGWLLMLIFISSTYHRASTYHILDFKRVWPPK